MKFDIWKIFFEKCVWKIRVSLKYDKNCGYFTWRSIKICDHISLNSSYNEKCFRKSCSESQNTYYVFNFFFENLFVYEILWKHTLQPVRPQMTIWLMRFACWITKATNTHSEYVILISFSRKKMNTRTRLGVITYIACLVNSSFEFLSS